MMSLGQFPLKLRIRENRALFVSLTKPIKIVSAQWVTITWPIDKLKYYFAPALKIAVAKNIMLQMKATSKLDYQINDDEFDKMYKFSYKIWHITFIYKYDKFILNKL